MEEKKNPFEKWSTKTTWGSSEKKDTISSTEYVPWWKREQKKKNYSSRLGFSESAHRRSYSSYYGGYYYGSSYYNREGEKDSRDLKKEKIEILKSAFSNSRDLVNILEFPFRLNIYYDADGYSRNIRYHKSVEKNIFINTVTCANFKSTSEITEDKRARCIQIISGNAIHEAANLKFTNISPTLRFFSKPSACTAYGDSVKFYIPDETAELKKFFNKFPKLNTTDKKFNNILRGIIYSIFTYLEEERVDNFLIEERNGWYSYINDYKNYICSVVFPPKKEKVFKEDTVYFEEFLSILYKFIRFRDNLSEQDIEKYDKLLEIAREYVHPSSTLESCYNAFLIFENVIYKVILEHNSKIEDFIKNLKLENLEEDKEEVDLKDIDLSELLHMLNSISTSSGAILCGNDKNIATTSDIFIKMNRSGISINPEELDIITGEIEGDPENGIFFKKPVGNLSEYNTLKERVSPYIPVIRNMVRNVNKNFEFLVHGQRNGKLDTTKLAEAYQGVPQVYLRQGITTTTGMTVCILIDESGSMHGNREILARDAAILLNEAFGGMKGIDLYIYGHTADLTYGSSTDINIYREPGMTGPVLGLGLTESQALYENRDGHAIKAIADRIRNFTKQPVLMFILSDGNPSACNYRGEGAVHHTAQKVKEVEKMGFNIIQVNINSFACASEKMFKNFVDITSNVAELPKVLGIIVRDQLSQILQNNTSTVTI